MPDYRIVIHEVVETIYAVEAEDRDSALKVFMSTQEDETEPESEETISMKVHGIIDPDNVLVPIIDEDEQVQDPQQVAGE